MLAFNTLPSMNGAWRLSGASGRGQSERVHERSSSGRLDGTRKNPIHGIRLPRRINACSRLPREGGPYGEE